MSETASTAKELAAEQAPLLRSLPVPLAALMQMQITRADYLFPAERRELDRMLGLLKPPRTGVVEQAVEKFSAIRLPAAMQNAGWESDPAGFVERMTAELWSSGQIDAFRTAAKQIVPVEPAENAEGATQPSRFAVIVLDARLRASTGTPKLFRKLRPHGTFFAQATDARGAEVLRQWIATRAASYPEPYAHWHLSGDEPGGDQSAQVVSLSYAGLRDARERLLARFNAARTAASGAGPEGLRQTLLHLTPEQIGLDTMKDPVLRQFSMEIFTDGSGTQMYSTTFVQWTIREALRRAQPRSLLARFTSRAEATAMDLLFAHPDLEPPPDAAGSLVDAEMGAYLSYLNMKRLPGAEKASFLVWHEGYGQALVIGSGIPGGAESSSAMSVQKLLSLTV